MAIVSCPECGKKLKVADTSIGKKVKGPCGHVFVAQGGAEAAPNPVAAGAPEKVYVGCTECGAKLKVATTSLGKKMKCPKCSATFVASLPDEEPAPKLKAKTNPDNDMDDLLAFAQADAAPGNGEADDANPFKNEPVKSRVQRKMDEEDAAEAISRAKAKPTKSDDDDEPMPMGKKPARKNEAPAKPVYPSRLLPNILVTLMVLAFGGLVGAIFFEVNVAKHLGLPEAKGVKMKLKTPENGGGKDKDAENKSKELQEQNKNELALLEGTWIVDSPEDLKGKKYTFAADKVTMPDGATAPFTVDTAHEPKWINLPGTGKTPGIPGIYALEGDTLRLCTGIPQPKMKKGKEVNFPGKRPTKIDGSEGMLVVLMREKKGEAPIPPDINKEENKKDNSENDNASKVKQPSPEERDAAKAQITVITQATQAYYLKNNEYPKTLQDLVDSKPPYLESKDALIDPWKQPFKYDPAGIKNGGLKPDIWAVMPNKEVIGNWPAAKKKSDDKGKDNSDESSVPK